MEEWQKKSITQNLPQLIIETKFNAVVKAGLLANNILTRPDVEELDAERYRKGKTSANYKLYECLLTRVGAYQVLAKILEENKQTGAVRILKNGFRNLQIPKILDGFNDMEINVQGKLVKVPELFSTDKLELAQQIFRETVSEMEFYDAFFTKNNTFVLATSSIPPEPPIYIPRFLSNRIEIPEFIFTIECADVFVFRNSIARYKLSEIAKPHWTATSSTQLRHITARFIYLDDYEDWIEMKKSARVSIHLIHYEDERRNYILEDSSAALEILSRIGSKKRRAYMSEEEFIQQQLSENLKASSVCICDTPGMGKTFLLANIARLMKKHCTGTIFAFIQLSTLVQDFTQSSENNTVEPAILFSNLLTYVSPSSKHAKFLTKLVRAELLRVELFFDGFDEIPTEKVEWMKQVFLKIKSDLTNVRIFITSRPHMRHELEKSLGVIAYDILPFNIKNQVDYLVQIWSPNVPQLDQKLLHDYALNCLEEINKSLTKDDKEMAGIPLLCWLIAEVCANKVHFYSTTGTKNVDLPLKIAEMYQKFIDLRIAAEEVTDDERNNIKLFHIWHALKLIFPTKDFHGDEILATVNQSAAPIAVLKAGIIIQLQSNTKLEFLHRTFAEYFVAEYFCTKSLKLTVKTNMSVDKIFNQYDESKKCLAVLLATTKRVHPIYKFVHAVIVSFVDFRLTQDSISEITKMRIISFCDSIPPQEFLAILCACCHHNFYNLFELLKEPPKKWHWNQRKIHFTTEACFGLLIACIRQSTSLMFHSCIQLFTEVLQLDVEQIAIHVPYYTLLHIAAEAANYEAVEYFVDRVPPQLQQRVLGKCVEKSYYNGVDMLIRRENILNLLLNKNPTLIQETSDILNTFELDLRLFKLLVKLGANLTAVSKYLAVNCAMHAARYMSPSDYHELVQFLLNDCKADYLFVGHEKWKDPLPWIIRWATVLPETLELLLNIPGIDINMKDENGFKLLIHAVQGNQVDNLQQLVDRGLDYNARGMINRSLLHVAAKEFRGVEMARYLLSLKLDPNSRDEDELTPLHYAAKYSTSSSFVVVLVENGANVHAKNSKGQTALHFSAQNGYPSVEVMRYLIGKGLGVNDRDNDGNTPLHFTCRKENRDCLIEMGADIHAKNNEGETFEQMNPDLFYPTN